MMASGDPDLYNRTWLHTIHVLSEQQWLLTMALKCQTSQSDFRDYQRQLIFKACDVLPQLINYLLKDKPHSVILFDAGIFMLSRFIVCTVAIVDSCSVKYLTTAEDNS